MARVTIYYTSDLHGRLTAPKAGWLAARVRETPGALLLDGGDAIQAGNLTARRSEPILPLMAETGYQAMAMGNRESHPRRSWLERKLREATFPVLAANLRSRRGPAPEIVRPYVVLKSGEVRVAVMGLAPEITRPSSLWARVTDFVFDEPLATAAELAPRLRAEAELVVCMSHGPHRVNIALAARPEVDLVLAGHTHRAEVIHAPGSALLVYAGSYASHVARIELSSRGEVVATLLPWESAV